MTRPLQKNLLIVVPICLIFPIIAIFCLIGKEKSAAIIFFIIGAFLTILSSGSLYRFNKTKEKIIQIFEDASARKITYGNIVSIKEESRPNGSRGSKLVFILTYSFKDSRGYEQTRKVQKPISNQDTINYLNRNQPFKIIYNDELNIYLIIKANK